jgi:hypothetical protein
MNSPNVPTLLRAWVLLFLDPERKGGVGVVRLASTNSLRDMILAVHPKVYPQLTLRKRQIEKFIQDEQARPRGILRLQLSANTLRWENIDPIIIDYRDEILRPRMTTLRNAERDNEVLSLFGFNT